MKGEGGVRQSLDVTDLPIIMKNNLSYLKYEWDNNVEPNSANPAMFPQSNVLTYVLAPSYTV